MDIITNLSTLHYIGLSYYKSSTSPTDGHVVTPLPFLLLFMHGKVL